MRMVCPVVGSQLCLQPLSDSDVMSVGIINFHIVNVVHVISKIQTVKKHIILC